MSRKAKNRLLAVVAVLVGVGVVAVLALGTLEDNIVYYWTPSDLLARQNSVHGATVRLGGMVQNETMHWDADTSVLSFVMGEKPEPGGPTVRVISKSAPPQMFREGIGCVVEGRFDGKVFHSERLMVKHSNEYKPPAEGEDPRKMYRTLMRESRADRSAGREAW